MITNVLPPFYGSQCSIVYLVCENIPPTTVQCNLYETHGSMAEYAQKRSRMIRNKYYTQLLTHFCL